MNQAWFDRCYGARVERLKRAAGVPVAVAERDERLRGLHEAEDCEQRTATEAASALNTMSTRGSLGIPFTVKQYGREGKWFIAYTSGALLDYVPYGSREEAMRAAKRAAAEEGVRVEESGGLRELVYVVEILVNGEWKPVSSWENRSDATRDQWNRTRGMAALKPYEVRVVEEYL